jgi:hypothetical protein
MVSVLRARVAVLAFLCSASCSKSYPLRPPEPQPIRALPPRYSVCAFDPGSCGGMIEKMSRAESSRGGGPSILLTGPLSGAPAVGRPSTLRRLTKGATQLMSLSSPKRGTPSAAPVSAPSRGQELIDLEVHLTIEAPDLEATAAAARRLTAQAGGQVANETFANNESQAGYTQSIRVPSGRTRWLIDALSRLGKVRSQRSEAKDLSRKVGDARTVLENLELALARYQVLAKQATTVSELTELERELDRVRTAIDRVKADLAWMEDRVAFSTVYLQVALPEGDRVSKRAKLYPGLRLPLAVALEPDGKSARYAGGGLSMFVLRPFNLDLDLMTNLDGARRRGVDLVVATVGVELYSDLLGGGRRRFLNPYFGFRTGYASFYGDHAVPIGGSVGVEIFRRETAFAALEGRAYAALATQGGTAVLFQPAAALYVAY